MAKKKLYLIVLLSVIIYQKNNCTEHPKSQKVVNNILTTQQSKVLKNIWVVPFFGAYKPIECLTYITDAIYFEGTADLVGGSYQPKITHLVIDNEKISLQEDLQPYFDQSFSRHPTIQQIVTRSAANHDHYIVKYILQYKNKRQKLITVSIEEQKPSYSIKQTDNVPITNNTYTVNSIVPTFEQKKLADHYETKVGDMSHITKNPHVIFFDDQGNLHTIQEEKLSVPILNLFLEDNATFLIRYHDIQLTTGVIIPLKQSSLTWRNTITAINGAFLCWVVYMIYNKLT